jgi:2-dehydropantoate 2-reductase
MKIAIVGTGAMGSIYAALLADAGNEVWAVDAWRDHVDAIRARGLRVEGASGDRTVRLHATTEAADVGKADMVVIATKARDVALAAKAATQLLGPETVVISIQNGLGSAERISAAMQGGPILLGVVGGFGASMKGPGHAHHNGWEFIRFGELAGGLTPRLAAAAKVWESAGFKVQSYADIHRMVWEKFICNVTFSGTCTLTGMTIGEVLADANAWAVASACAVEAFSVAKAKGIQVDIAEPVAYVRAFGAKISGARPSMLLDHMARRRSEIDAINGAVPPAAAAVGLAAPVNTTVASLIRARERDFT